MALPPRVHPPFQPEPLTSNRIVLGGTSLQYAHLEETLVVRRLPAGKRIRIAWLWEGHENAKLTIWLEKIEAGARYQVEAPGTTFEIQASEHLTWEAPAPNCRWLPARFWEAAFWRRRR